MMTALDESQKKHCGVTETASPPRGGQSQKETPIGPGGEDNAFDFSLDRAQIGAKTGRVSPLFPALLLWSVV